MNKSLLLVFVYFITSQVSASLTSLADGHVTAASISQDNAASASQWANYYYNQGKELKEELEALWQGPPIDPCYEPYVSSATGKLSTAFTAKTQAFVAFSNAGTAETETILYRDEVYFYELHGNYPLAYANYLLVIAYAGSAQTQEGIADTAMEDVIDLVGDIAVLAEEADNNC
jgi:hypothetical protein